MGRIAPYAKAIVAALVAGLGSVATSLQDGNSFGDLTASDWVTASLAFLVALGAVFAIPNRSSG